jgi:hypothetical protein
MSLSIAILVLTVDRLRNILHATNTCSVFRLLSAAGGVVDTVWPPSVLVAVHLLAMPSHLDLAILISGRKAVVCSKVYMAYQIEHSHHVSFITNTPQYTLTKYGSYAT